MVFVPYYSMPTSHPKFSWPDQKLIDEALGYIQRINPKITKIDDVLATYVGRLRHAQPICVSLDSRRRSRRCKRRSPACKSPTPASITPKTAAFPRACVWRGKWWWRFSHERNAGANRCDYHARGGVNLCLKR